MTIHIGATPDQIAETVLLPGDPYRAKWAAETFLSDVALVNEVRGMLGFTGLYKDHRVTIQGSGMGMPSLSIYANELIKDYGAKTLIRIGSCGGMQPHVGIRDIILAMTASSISTPSLGIFKEFNFAPCADYALLEAAARAAQAKAIATHIGGIYSSDVFYDERPDLNQEMTRHGILGVEMEAAELYNLAARYGVRALTVLTVSDHLQTGEALPAAVGEGWLALTGVDILDGVGSTEMLHIFLSNRAGDVAYGTSGVAVPGYDLRLVDEAGVEVGVGEIGELLVAGDSAADGYWNQREKSRGTFEGIWTRTGDKYERAADGRLIYCGRTDDMFKVSGIWVSPFEVEQSIAAHDDVIEAAVVPATDNDGLLKPKAFVVLKPDVEAGGIDEAIKAHVKADIGKWKYPRWVEIVDDLPKTATGKIQRFKLREGA